MSIILVIITNSFPWKYSLPAINLKHLLNSCLIKDSILSGESQLYIHRYFVPFLYPLNLSNVGFLEHPILYLFVPTNSAG